MKTKVICFILFVFSISMFSQNIPQHISYTGIYDFLDELANDGLIDLNSAIKPYSRTFIANQLLKVRNDKKLSRRQAADVQFYLNEFALETDKLPQARMKIINNPNTRLALIPPAFHYRDSMFKARITPLLGLHFTYNATAANPTIVKRWYGAEIQTMIGKHLSVYGSLRDISVDGDTLASYRFLNNLPGYEYKEASYGGDFSDSRGGITYANDWSSVGLIKDNPVWGDSYQCSNILSGRTPSFPMVTLHLKPAKWFELNYFHAWLISNVLDSTNFYTDNLNKRYFRPANKFMAANMFTFTPFRNLKISVGNSIIYGENNVQAAYFIPVAFYKSLDHLLTKGTGTENQNSQVFFNFSSRNIKHLHLYGSVFFDEVSFDRFLPSNKEQNPMSLKAGAKLSNFPLKNISLVAEYNYTNIITYKHSLPNLTYASNSYNLGHYLGDNSSELFVALHVKPFRGFDLKANYTVARKGNDFEYVRLSAKLREIISQPVLSNVVWSSKSYGVDARYEVFNNVFCIFSYTYSNIEADNSKSTIVYETEKTAAAYLKRFSNPYMHGKNSLISMGINFGF